MRPKVILFAMLLTAVTCCIPAAPLYAQKKHSPDDKKVEKMVRKAMAYLRKNHSSEDRNCLAALAIVQATKRYDARVPEGDAYVDKIVKSVRAEVNGGRLLNHQEMYYPCLALILLCEMDDQLYRPEIDKLIKMFEERQLKDGAFTYKGKKTWDTSQTQFVALAYFVARQHKVNVKIDSSKRILEFMMGAQEKDVKTWTYTKRDVKLRLSIHAACSGTVYLLGDLLRLQPRLKQQNAPKASALGLDLPDSISIYIPQTAPGEGATGDGQWGGTGPLVNINQQRLKEVKNGANKHFNDAYNISTKKWPYYYLYALERYAYFREQAEGNMGSGALRNWYDDGVEALGAIQKPDGSFPDGPEPNSPSFVNTAFAVMFLVRSSEVLSLPPNTSSLTGGNDLARLRGKKLKEMRAGQIQSNETSQDLNELLKSLNEDLSSEQLSVITDSLREAIREYQSRPETSRVQAQGFLRLLVKDKNYFKRLIAVRFLAGEQDLDNAPALIYALGDPDVRVAIEAHNGLRLISRKIDSIKLPEKPTRGDLESVKQQWTSWYTKLRPSGKLFD